MVNTKRPYVICHMSPAIDGKIVAGNWPSIRIVSAEYERTAATLKADAWIIGRVSMAAPTLLASGDAPAFCHTTQPEERPD